MRLSAAAGMAWDCAVLAVRRTKTPSFGAIETPRRILVLGYAAIGDLIFLLPALRELRRAYPKARIVFVADKYAGTTELLPASGLIDEIRLYEHSELASRSTRRDIAERVKEGRFDLLVVSPATPMRPFARAVAGIPTRVGHFRDLSDPRAGWLTKLKRGVISEEIERRLVLNRPVPMREEGEHTITRNLRLIEALGVPLSKDADAKPELPENDAQRRFADQAVPARDGVRTLGLHLGPPGNQYHKIWPAANWGIVARRLADAFPCRIVLLGGMTEKEVVPHFLRQFQGETIDLVGRSTFLETCAVLRRCDLFMSSDTGPVKAAMALGVPTATVWGPTSRADNGVYWDPDLHCDIAHPVPCAPCVRVGMRVEGKGVLNFTNCGHHDCLSRLHPDQVFAAVRDHFTV